MSGGLPAACKNVCFSPVPFSLSHREQTLLFLSMMSSNGNMRPAAPLLRGHGLRKELLSLEKVESWSWCSKLCLLYTSPDSSSFCPVHLIGCFSGPYVCVFVMGTDWPRLWASSSCWWAVCSLSTTSGPRLCGFQPFLLLIHCLPDKC